MNYKLNDDGSAGPLMISDASPNARDVQALLAQHFRLMRAQSPAESCHVMTPEELAGTQGVLLCARQDDNLLGVAALKLLSASEGEIKSMHTAAAARGQGVGKALILALFERAKDLGLERLSLETGTDEVFAPARSLYQAHGFDACPPFAGYVVDPLCIFMTREL